MIKNGWRSGVDDRGLSPGLELVILLPALLILIGATVAGGRLWFARSTVDEAAYSGARAASLERSAGAARSSGQNIVIAELHTDGVHCLERSITIDTGGFHAKIGAAATVRAVVRCRLSFADVALPGMPGSLLVTGRASAPIDSYRERR